MKWEFAWNDPFTHYLEPFDSLVGDRRTWTTLTETVRGIIGSGCLICQRIAAQSPILESGSKRCPTDHSHGDRGDHQTLARSGCRSPHRAVAHPGHRASGRKRPATNCG